MTKTVRKGLLLLLFVAVLLAGCATPSVAPTGSSVEERIAYLERGEIERTDRENLSTGIGLGALAAYFVLAVVTLTNPALRPVATR